MPRLAFCINGHYWGLDNFTLSSAGRKQCRTCADDREKAREARKEDERRLRRKTHCRKGHLWIPQNIMLVGGDRKRCRQCHNERNEAYRRSRGIALRVATGEYMERL